MACTRSSVTARWAGWLKRGASANVAALVVIATGCVGGPSGRAAPGAQAPATETSPKSITIAFPIDPTALAGSMSGLGAAAVPSRYFREFTNAYLTTHDARDELVPWLVTDLPSLDDGTWKVLDDDRMEVTWKLRHGITWQDGAELTSDDLKFSWEVSKDPTTTLAPQGIARYVESVETPDPYTATFIWGQVSQLGIQAGVREFDVLPRHVLGDVERAGFSDNAYFTDPGVFVGSGPFRAVAWDRGSSITLQANDAYFLGRPKIDRVTFTIIRDTQAALANMLAGRIDIAYWTISNEGARIIAQEWSKAGGGTVEMQPNNARHLLPQLRPDYATPRDLTDVRVRKALMYAMDRAELAETAAPGAAEVVNSTTYPDSALGKVVEERAIHYDPDPARAQALFAETGWQKGPDGMLTKLGERFQLSLRTGNASSDAGMIFPVLQQQYRAIGIDLALDTSVPADVQAEATFSGVWFTALPDNQTGFLSRFNSALIAGPQNRWAGTDRNGYANPAADELLRRVDRTLRRDERIEVWAEANRVLVDDVAFMPLYNYPYPYVVAGRVVGATPGNPINPPSYFPHTWDVR
ncbi:MAG TPA: peptide ABC transporter substrate-binding protein [Chloroflexota bacterium]|nr:peptide ABC transporter substrate-binding protein [Chloroflexota bacterium]